MILWITRKMHLCSHRLFFHTDLKDYKDCYAALRLHRTSGATLVDAIYRVANSVAIFKIFKIRVRRIRVEIIGRTRMRELI